MHIVKNTDINHEISHYLDIYNSEGVIAFELMPSECKELGELIKWFKDKKKTKEPMDREVYEKELHEIGTSHDSSASFVFSFISQNWNKNTHVSIEELGDQYLVAIKKISRH